ncbi:hypothetical protein E2C01_042259 [Portunus trituberculatus]|uniref:Secreted protein n=1 Tax=Portunus trituberculatus TaxID=210409 RepID=A0A5B7FSL1_PORTR|nr:hypothetical protein [Portunus trituberculatus]
MSFSIISSLLCSEWASFGLCSSPEPSSVKRPSSTRSGEPLSAQPSEDVYFNFVIFVAASVLEETLDILGACEDQ